MIDEIGVNLIIQRETRVEGSYLGDTVTWSTHLSLKGSIQNISGYEAIQAEKLGVNATHRLYINGSSDIKKNDRVLYNGVYYQITYIDNVVNIGSHMKIFLDEGDNYGIQSN